MPSAPVPTTGAPAQPAALAAQIAAQIAALLGQPGQAQGVIINIILGDIHIDADQIVLGGQPAAKPNP